MGDETFIEKTKELIYKLLLKPFLWSIGYKTINDYVKALKTEYFYSDLEKLFLIPYEHGMRKAVMSSVKADEHGYILRDTFPCFEQKELERFAHSINKEKIIEGKPSHEKIKKIIKELNEEMGVSNEVRKEVDECYYEILKKYI